MKDKTPPAVTALVGACFDSARASGRAVSDFRGIAEHDTAKDDFIRQRPEFERAALAIADIPHFSE